MVYLIEACGLTLGKAAITSALFPLAGTFGALLAGCRHVYGYPITSSTEGAELMAKLLPQLNGVFVQAISEVGGFPGSELELQTVFQFKDEEATWLSARESLLTERFAAAGVPLDSQVLRGDLK